MHYFETTAGTKIQIQPISLLDLQLAQDAVETEFKAAGKQIEPPTYEVEVLGGDKEYHSHTEKTIESGTDKEKELWAKYLQDKAELEGAKEDKSWLVLLDGIVIDLPEDDKWIRRRKKIFNEDVPEDEDERLLYYINKILLKTPADQTGLYWAIIELSMTGAKEEAISAMKQLFFRSVGISQRAGVEAIEALLEEGQDLVLQSDVERRNSSQIEEYDLEAIPELTD